jgi:hypothetical protein
MDVRECNYNTFISRVVEVFRDKPYYALAELALFKDITLDILLYHFEKYPGIKTHKIEN